VRTSPRWKDGHQTVAQIAAEFGVTRPTIYRYLDAKSPPPRVVPHEGRSARRAPDHPFATPPPVPTRRDITMATRGTAVAAGDRLSRRHRRGQPLKNTSVSTLCRAADVVLANSTDGGVSVTGNPGAGKTAMTAELVRRGRRALDTDDIAGWVDTSGAPMRDLCPLTARGEGQGRHGRWAGIFVALTRRAW